MKNGFQGLRIAGTVAIISLTPGLAWSYIDPGNGAYVVQLLFTVAGAALFYIRHPIRFLQAVWNWCFSRDSKGEHSGGAAMEVETGSTELVTDTEPGRSE